MWVVGVPGGPWRSLAPGTKKSTRKERIYKLCHNVSLYKLSLHFNYYILFTIGLLSYYHNLPKTFFFVSIPGETTGQLHINNNLLWIFYMTLERISRLYFPSVFLYYLFVVIPGTVLQCWRIWSYVTVSDVVSTVCFCFFNSLLIFFS